jgi:hypothetical protein
MTAGDVPDPANIVHRRLLARMRYRQMRDRKIPIDYLGRHFEYRHRNEIDGHIEWLPLQLVAYDPSTAIIKMRALWYPPEVDAPSVPWDTDTFWGLYRTGGLRDAA